MGPLDSDLECKLDKDGHNFWVVCGLLKGLARVDSGQYFFVEICVVPVIMVFSNSPPRPTFGPNASYLGVSRPTAPLTPRSRGTLTHICQSYRQSMMVMVSDQHVSNILEVTCIGPAIFHQTAPGQRLPIDLNVPRGRGVRGAGHGREWQPRPPVYRPKKWMIRSNM